MNINNANGIAEISSRTVVLLKDLQKEKVGVVRMVTALNTVARAGKSDINIMVRRRKQLTAAVIFLGEFLEFFYTFDTESGQIFEISWGVI